MLRKLLVACTAMSLSQIALSQDIASVTTQTSSSTKTITAENNEVEKKPFFAITGSADAYYKFDFAKTKANTFTSFTGTHNSFALGMASVKVEHKTDKVGVVLDLGFGQRAKEFSYNDEGITQAIKQLYVSYSPTNWLKFTAGSWATHVGYELLDPQLNRNYSMSYMFTNGPFSHTGLKADITSGKHAFMVGISNATDFRTPPDGMINKKFILAQAKKVVNGNGQLQRKNSLVMKMEIFVHSRSLHSSGRSPKMASPQSLLKLPVVKKKFHVSLPCLQWDLSIRNMKD